MSTSTGDEPDPRRWRALWVSQLAGFMGLLDVSIVNVALPSIERSLGTSAAQVQWIVSGYALTFGLMLVAGGRLGDALGRRRMFLIALSGFVVASAVVGAAPTAETLVAARLVQGLFAGLLTPQNSGLIQDLFRGPERGRAFGVFGATVGLSTAIGPVLGGVIIAVAGAEEGWRWVFYVNVPLGVLALVLAARLLPASTTPRGPVLARLDLFGAGLLGAAVLAAMFPLVQAESGGLSRYWWLFGVAVVLGVGFVRWEHRVLARDGAPLLDTRLLRSTPGYAGGALVGLFYFVGFSGIWLVFALYYQFGLQYTPLQSGLAVTPFALGSAVSAAVAGRLVTRYGRLLTVVGLVAVMIGLAGTAVVLRFVDPGSVWWAAIGPLVLAGLGGGAVISPNITLTLDRVPVRMAGAAAGAVQTGQRLGAAVGTAVLATVFYAVLAGADDQASYRAAVFVALLTAVAVLAVSLAVTILDLRHGRFADRAPERPVGQNAHR